MAYLVTGTFYPHKNSTVIFGREKVFQNWNLDVPSISLGTVFYGMVLIIAHLAQDSATEGTGGSFILPYGANKKLSDITKINWKKKYQIYVIVPDFN